MERRKIIIIASISIAILILSGIFYFFVFSKDCTSEECFIKSLQKCQRASYKSISESSSWQYKITSPFGFSGGSCSVKVKNLYISEKGSESIKGKSMSCKIPIESSGNFIQIHSRLEFCSGPLKENLQALLIDKLYKYIILNIGGITEEIRKN